MLFSWIKNNILNTANSQVSVDQQFLMKQAIPQETSVTMDELGDQHMNQRNSNDKDGKSKSHLIYTNEKGDILKQIQDTTIKPKIPVNISLSASKTKSKTELTYKEFVSQECTQKQAEKFEELKREKRETDENAEVLEIPLPFRAVGERSSLTNLHNLMEQCPQPQPPLINKQLKTLQLSADQAIIMTEQVQRMKSGMERLQEIIKKFNCTEKFKQDIDFIIANVGPAIAKAERVRHDEEIAYNTNNKAIP